MNDRRRHFSGAALVLAALLGWATCPATAQQPGTRAAYASAAALQKQGLYDLATDAWRDLLAEAPDGPLAPRARYNLGVCQFHAGAFDKAAAQFSTVADADRFPELADAALANLGLARLNASRARLADPNHQPERVVADLTAAVEAFARGLAAFPSGGHMAANHFHRGEALLLLEKPADAAESFRQVLKVEGIEKPLARQARVGLGNALLAAGAFGEIATAVAPVVDDQTAPLMAAEARLLRAEAALALEKPADAAVGFAAASRVAGFVDGAYAAERAAFSWYTAGEVVQAAEAYESLVERFADSPLASTARLSAGKCWLLAKQPGKAIEPLAAAWRTAPTAANAEAAQWCARALLDLKQPDEALATASEALATQPLAPAPLQLLAADAMAAIQTKRAAAIDAYVVFADTWPDDAAAPRALVTAAGIALEKSAYPRAMKLAERVLQLDLPAKLAIDARSLLAESAALAGKKSVAIDAFKQLTQTAADDPRAGRWLEGLAAAYESSDQPDAAIATLGRLLARESEGHRTVQAHYTRGRLLTTRGDLVVANEDFQAVVDAAPQQRLAAYARLALATNKHTAGEHPAAIATLKTMLALGQTELDGRARFLLATSQHAAGNAAAAIKNLDTAQAEPAELLRLRTLCLIELGRIDEAKQVVDKGERQNADVAVLAQLRHELGWAYRDADRDDAALTAFARSAELQPEGKLAAESRFRVGEIHSAAKRHAEAAAAFSQAARLSEADVELREQALHLLGWSHWNNGAIPPAAAAFREQLKASPVGKLVSDGRLMLGECLFAQEKFAEALASYREAFRGGVDGDASNLKLRPLALLHAGQAAGQAGDWKESLQLLEEARTLTQGTPLANEARYEWAWALHKLNRNAEAAPEFTQLANSSQGVLAARAAFIRGELHFAAKEYDQAVRMFFRVAYGYGGRDAPPGFHPWQAESLFEAARCLEQLDRIDPARKLYAELVERFPESPKARLARDRLPEITAAAP